MKINEILSAAGKKKSRKRIGRGGGSGQGGTAGRGHKGYHARAGSGRLVGFEGGQTPVLARSPKRGFNNANFRKEYQIVNVAALQERFEDGARVDVQTLHEARMIEDSTKPVKVLGNGELSVKLTVVAQAFSASAREKITQAGGTVEQA